MLAIVEPARLDEVLALARKWEIRATVVGRVTDTDRFRVFDGLFDALGVPGENPAPPIGDTAPEVSSDREPVADVPVGSLGDGPLYHRPTRTPGRAGCAAGRRSRAAAARQVPGGIEPERRAARAARDADDRRQDVGFPPVRPSAVPVDRRGTRRRRRGAAREGHAARRSRSRPTARHASVISTRASARSWWCSKRRATSPARERDRSRWSTASTSAIPSTPR